MATPTIDWLHIEQPELKELAIATLAMALAFSWRFAGPATFGNWLGNFIIVLILVAISVAVHEVVHRTVAARHLAKVGTKVFRTGIIAMLLITLITNGWLVIAVPWAVSILPLYFFRPGMGTKAHLGPWETALIAVSGPLANLGLAVLAKILLPSFGLIAEKLLAINVALAIFNLVPFFTIFPMVFLGAGPAAKKKISEIPYVEGEFVFFGSKPLWGFTFTFAVIAGLSLFVFGALASLLIAFVAAAFLWAVWHYYEIPRPVEYKKEGKPVYSLFRIRPPKPI